MRHVCKSGLKALVLFTFLIGAPQRTLGQELRPAPFSPGERYQTLDQLVMSRANLRCSPISDVRRALFGTSEHLIVHLSCADLTRRTNVELITFMRPETNGFVITGTFSNVGRPVLVEQVAHDRGQSAALVVVCSENRNVPRDTEWSVLRSDGHTLSTISTSTRRLEIIRGVIEHSRRRPHCGEFLPSVNRSRRFPIGLRTTDLQGSEIHQPGCSDPTVRPETPTQVSFASMTCGADFVILVFVRSGTTFELIGDFTQEGFASSGFTGLIQSEGTVHRHQRVAFSMERSGYRYGGPTLSGVLATDGRWVWLERAPAMHRRYRIVDGRIERP